MPHFHMTRTPYLAARAPRQLQQSTSNTGGFSTQQPIHPYTKQSILLLPQSNTTASSYVMSADRFVNNTA